jgi:hypothetical protein
MTQEEYKDYIEADQIVRKYKSKINENLLKETSSRSCIKCGNKLELISPESTKYLEPEKGMWLGGTVFKISCGFGSYHDTQSYIIALCDDCIDKLHKDNIIENEHDLMERKINYIDKLKGEN